MDALRELRRQKGWSQRDLARESGVGADTISGIESGRHEARPSTLRKLAGAFGVEVADLLRETPAPKVQASGPWRVRLRALNKEKKRDLALAAKGVVSDTWLGATTTRELRALKAFMSEYDVGAEEVLETLIDDTPGLEEMLNRLVARARTRAEEFAEESRKAVDATLEHATTERGA